MLEQWFHGQGCEAARQCGSTVGSGAALGQPAAGVIKRPVQWRQAGEGIHLAAAAVFVVKGM